MSRISRLVVLVTALASLFAVLSSTAGAVTFTNDGGTNFHATGGQGTLTVTSPSTNLVCTNSTASGSVGMGAFTAVHGTVTFNVCSLVGLETHVNCGYTLTPLSFTAGSPAVTDGVADVNCTVSLRTSPFTALCNITGQTAGAYTNPVAPSTPGKVTLVNSGTLVVSNSSGSSCSAAGVPAGGTASGDLSEQTLTLTSFAESPFITSP